MVGPLCIVVQELTKCFCELWDPSFCISCFVRSNKVYTDVKFNVFVSMFLQVLLFTQLMFLSHEKYMRGSCNIYFVNSIIAEFKMRKLRWGVKLFAV